MATRRYGQYCAIAKALDVLGDRWALLIVRELLFGAQRYSELQAALPGIATDMLADRACASSRPPAWSPAGPTMRSGTSSHPVAATSARFSRPSRCGGSAS